MEIIDNTKKKSNIKYLFIFLAAIAVENVVGIILLVMKESIPIFSTKPILNSVVFLLSKLISLIIVLFLLRKGIITELRLYRKNALRILIVSLAGLFIYNLLNMGLAYYQEFISMITDTDQSLNQSGIIEFFEASKTIPNYIILCLIIIVIAPLLEEIVFRKLFFKMFENKHYLLPVFVSAIVFAISHIQTISINEFLYIPFYLFPGLLFSLVYHYSNKSIVPSLVIHIVNNTISCVQIITLLNSTNL